MSRITYDLRGTREVRKLLDDLSGRELQNRTRRGVRAGAAIGRKSMRSMARDPRYPSAYRGPVGRGGIATKNHGVRSRTGGIGTSVGPTTQLLNLFEPGVGIHQIGESGDLLRGSGGEHYRPAPFMARGPVRHPGFPAVPLIDPVFRKEQNRMGEAAMDKLLEGIKP